MHGCLFLTFKNHNVNWFYKKHQVRKHTVFPVSNEDPCVDIFTDCTYLLGLFKKHRSVHKMPWEGRLQGHSKISGRVLGHFDDIFSLILHGYESGEWHSYRPSTQ